MTDLGGICDCRWLQRNVHKESDTTEWLTLSLLGFPSGIAVKNWPANAGDTRVAGSILGLGRSSRGGNDNPVQYSCLDNPMDRRDWRATVHEVTKSWTWLSNWAHWATEIGRARSSKVLSTGLCGIWILFSVY